jgi:putative two-component system response regulator
VNRRTQEVLAIQDVTILALGSLAEARDNETGNHIRRTQHYVKRLALALKDHPRFQAYLSDAQIDLLFKSAPLHDIGKVGIPDHILLKPGKLDDAEFEIMKTHTTIGRDAIERAEAALGMPVAFLSCAKEIAYSHQEKWDGSGYPLGLAGDAIPVSARLMAVADVYDALISKRVYKPAFSHDKAVAIITEGSHKHFDPAVVQAFLSIASDFAEIAQQYTDAHEQQA